MNTKFQTIGELFCGPGGGGLGASMSNIKVGEQIIGMRHLWATDFDKDSCDTYKANIEKYEKELGIKNSINIINDDINNIDLSETGPLKSVDGLIFGFPCNDFSIVGKSRGTDGKYGPLYKHGIKVLNRKDKPNWFFAENVGGITSANEGQAFKNILQEMKDSGYDLFAHKYNFEDYGVPQKRHRIIIVGFKSDLNIKFKIPAPTHQDNSVGNALKSIPKAAHNQEPTVQSKVVVERLKYIKPGQNAWNADIPDELKLKVKKTTLSNIYRRLDKEKPAYTLTGSGGGGTHMYHWKENRALTNRERARIQTFPDNYRFFGSKESVRKQIGMAIPPIGATHVFKAILCTIMGLQYDYVKANINIKEAIQHQHSFDFDEV